MIMIFLHYQIFIETSLIFLKKKGNSDQVFVYKEQAKEIDHSQYHLEISESDINRSLEKLKYQLNNSKNLTSIERIDLFYQIGLRLMKKKIISIKH